MNQEFHELHSEWILQSKKEEEKDVVETEGHEGEEVTTEVPVEVNTPVAFAPQDLPAMFETGMPSSILQGIESLSIVERTESSSDVFTNDRIATVSSPTLSISTISDLAPTELGEDTKEGGGELVPTCHKTFYLEDGNVEIVCGYTIFRVHSPILSFSSPKLRDMFSPSTLLTAPMPEGCPRIFLKDSAQDFAVLLRMIYTPGYVSPLEL